MKRRRIELVDHDERWDTGRYPNRIIKALDLYPEAVAGITLAFMLIAVIVTVFVASPPLGSAVAWIGGPVVGTVLFLLLTRAGSD